MNTRVLVRAAALALPLWLAGCGASDTPAEAEAPAGGHGDGAAGEETRKGPHGGRLLEDGPFTLELAIFEHGVPPEFRAWTSRDGKSLAPAEVQLNVTLERLGGVSDRIAFEPKADYLRGTQEVYEPHSFTVTVVARADGARHEWRYESFEGRTTIPKETARQAGVVIATAGPRVIQDMLPLYGVIVPNPDRVSAVGARYPGVITRVTRAVGEEVGKGDLLAVVESDESLRSYSVSAPIAGVVTARRANAGQHSGTDALFTITDLSSVWAELSVFPRDMARLKPGQRVRVRSVDGGEAVEGELVHLNPAGAGVGQVLAARVVLANAEGRWTPGLYVNAEVLIGGAEVPVAIRPDAVQRFRDWQVAFENVGDIYEARPLELGRSDGQWLEVKSGLKAGARYVAGGSFLVKADIEKSGASHDH